MGRSRCSSIKRTTTAVAGRALARRNSTPPENLIRPLQLEHFGLKVLNFLRIICSSSRALARVNRCLSHPATQCISIDSLALRNPNHRPIQRQLRTLLPGLFHKPQHTLPQLLRIPPLYCHSPHPSGESDPPPNPGRFKYCRQDEKPEPCYSQWPPRRSPMGQSRRHTRFRSRLIDRKSTRLNSSHV